MGATILSLAFKRLQAMWQKAPQGGCEAPPEDDRLEAPATHLAVVLGDVGQEAHEEILQSSGHVTNEL